MVIVWCSHTCTGLACGRIRRSACGLSVADVCRRGVVLLGFGEGAQGLAHMVRGELSG